MSLEWYHAYVRMLQQNDPKQRILIYTGDVEPAEEILKRAQDRFNLPPVPGCVPVDFVRLRMRRLVTAELYPRFTMFGQSIGSIILAAEAMWIQAPHVFIDTTGFAFTYPLAKYIFGASVHCYTHYPTISSDMLQLVFDRRESYNNSSANSRSLLRARVKWIYYRFFALLYECAGRASDLVFVNSTWTRNHIDAIWNIPQRTHTVYPPCDTDGLRQIPLGDIATLDKAANDDTAKSSQLREELIISLSQFRPEKDHPLQIRSFALFLDRLRALESSSSAPSSSDSLASIRRKMRLVLIGGVRDQADAARVEELKQLAVELGISDQVEFHLNIPFSELKQWLARATVGLHTMWNEHFGIGVVEFMAAGVITLAHNSGGPKSDILVPLPSGQRVGYLCSTAAEYATALVDVFASAQRGTKEMNQMRLAARMRAMEYSDEVFIEELNKRLTPFINKCRNIYQAQTIKENEKVSIFNIFYHTQQQATQHQHQQ